MESNLKDRFEDFGSTPTNGLWDRIEVTLDEKPKRKPLLGWIYYAVASILIVSMMIIPFQKSEISHIEQNTATSQLNKKKENKNFGKSNTPLNSLAESSNAISDTKNSAKKTTPSDSFLENLKEKKEKNQKKKAQKSDETKFYNSQNSYNQKEENKKEITIDSMEMDQKNENLDIEEDSRIAIKSDEKHLPNVKDSSDNNTTTKSNTDTISLRSEDFLSDSKSKPRFEIGLSYSSFFGTRTEFTANNSSFSDGNNSVPNTMLSFEILASSDSNVKYYGISMPINFHLTYAYYLHSNWRLDSELGYSQFKYTYLDDNKIKLADYPIIRSISIPLSISYVKSLREPQHSLNCGAGFVNDFSFANWNSSNRFYYSLSAQIKVGYGFRFGATTSWKTSINFIMRQSIFENSIQNSGFNNRLLYGGQIGIAKCF